MHPSTEPCPPPDVDDVNDTAPWAPVTLMSLDHFVVTDDDLVPDSGWTIDLANEALDD